MRQQRGRAAGGDARAARASRGAARSSTRCCRTLCRRAAPGRALLAVDARAAARSRSRSNAGVAHYYGVGAYLRPLDDARRARGAVRLRVPRPSPTCPTARLVERMLGRGERPPHHPRWKARVPRDLGAGWDFEDVRDHYLERLFGVDPLELRYSDHERYLALGRLTSGEVMAAVFAEWRRRRSTCAGGLVWFLRDLWPGAGWGVLDAHGRPKAAYYYLRRALQPVAVFFTDEGLNGLSFHAVNETARCLGRCSSR